MTWTSTDQRNYRILIAPTSAPTQYVYDSGLVTSTDTAHEAAPESGLPALVDGVEYVLTLRTEDDKQRVALPGSPIYGEDQATFTVDVSAVLLAPVGLIASQVGYTPWVRLSWERPVAPAPDAWEIRADGVVVEVITPGDAYVDGTSWVYRTGVSPQVRRVAWSVRAVEDGDRSPDSNTQTVAARADGIWLLDPDTGDSFCLRGDEEEPDFDAPEISSSYRAASGRTVRRVTALGGLEFEVAGLLYAEDDEDFEAQLAVVYAMKSNPDRPYRLTYLDLNIPVNVGEVVPSATWRTDTDDLVKQVRLRVWQDGETPWSLES